MLLLLLLAEVRLSLPAGLGKFCGVLGLVNLLGFDCAVELAFEGVAGHCGALVNVLGGVGGIFGAGDGGKSSVRTALLVTGN